MKLYIHCPGCLHEIAKAPPERPSIHAQRGTELGELADLVLTDYLKHNRSGKILSKITVDELFIYVKFVADLAGEKWDLEIQPKCNKGLIRYHPGIWGTADARVRNLETSTTHIADLKCGAGIMVPVMDEEDGSLNPQLELYLLDSLIEMPTAFGQLHIVQPWGSKERGLEIVRSSPVLKTEDLFNVNLPRILAALKACDDAKPGEGLNPGPWCGDSFCPARLTCPALNAMVREAQVVPFNPVGLTHTPDQLLEIKRKAELARTWASEAESYLLAEADAGRCPTGYQLEQGMGNRKWKEGTQEAAVVKATGLPKKDCYSPGKILSPTQLEKAVNNDLVWAGIAEKFVVREPTSKKLVKIKAGEKPVEPVFQPQPPQDPNVIPTTARKVEESTPVYDVAAMLGV